MLWFRMPGWIHQAAQAPGLLICTLVSINRGCCLIVFKGCFNTRMLFQCHNVAGRALVAIPLLDTACVLSPACGDHSLRSSSAEYIRALSGQTGCACIDLWSGSTAAACVSCMLSFWKYGWMHHMGIVLSLVLCIIYALPGELIAWQCCKPPLPAGGCLHPMQQLALVLVLM